VSGRWRHPGWSGAAVYAITAGLIGAVITVVSRLQIAGVRGRVEVVRGLPDGPVIVISNHSSYADGLLLMIICRRLGRSARMLATAGVFKAPLIGTLARRMGFIPVARGTANAADALDPAAEALAAGEVVALFPEGRVTRDPNQWPERAKTGAVRLALRTGAPIVPVAMEGAYRVVGRRKMVRKLVRNVILRPKVETAIGDPIDVRALLVGEETQEEVRRLTDLVMSKLIDLVESLRGEQAPDPAGVARSPD
jgi:1-acyl-sn-glycerol-3-phosphate acyltransferase